MGPLTRYSGVTVGDTPLQWRHSGEYTVTVGNTATDTVTVGNTATDTVTVGNSGPVHRYSGQQWSRTPLQWESLPNRDPDTDPDGGHGVPPSTAPSPPTHYPGTPTTSIHGS